MQNVHYVAALDSNARFVHFFSCDSARAPVEESIESVGQQLGARLPDDDEARMLRATFAECLYSGESQECVVSDESGRRVQCRFDKVVRNSGRTLRSDDEVVAIAVACDLPDPIELSEREREIVRLICRDKGNAEIAKILKIKSSTIETHRQNIRQKLGVNGTSGIVLYAVQHGLVDPQNS